MSDTNFTYGETTVLADTDDIAQVTETVQSGIEQVLADTEDLNNDHSTLDAKLDTITTELSAIKKSVSDGKTLVAGAITAKGIDTATDAEFATIASNIESIVTLDSAPGLEAQSYTPGTSNIVIGAGNYLKGDQTIVGDSNLVAGNIAKGKSIFGVTGTYAPIASLSSTFESVTVNTSAIYDYKTANANYTLNIDTTGKIPLYIYFFLRAGISRYQSDLKCYYLKTSFINAHSPLDSIYAPFTPNEYITLSDGSRTKIYESLSSGEIAVQYYVTLNKTDSSINYYIEYVHNSDEKEYTNVFIDGYKLYYVG